MSTETRTMEHLLETLGKAHHQGAFSGGSSGYPWETAEPQHIKLSARRFAGTRFAWARVVGPLATAAAVALLFVAPKLLQNGSFRDAAENVSVSVTPDKPELFADAEPTPNSAAGLDCDYNGDGQIDGRDIQASLEQAKLGDPNFDKEKFMQCLLGG